MMTGVLLVIISRIAFGVPRNWEFLLWSEDIDRFLNEPHSHPHSTLVEGISNYRKDASFKFPTRNGSRFRPTNARV